MYLFEVAHHRRLAYGSHFAQMKYEMKHMSAQTTRESQASREQTKKKKRQKIKMNGSIFILIISEVHVLGAFCCHSALGIAATNGEPNYVMSDAFPFFVLYNFLFFAFAVHSPTRYERLTSHACPVTSFHPHTHI